MMLSARTIKEREILLICESTDGNTGFMTESLFRTEQNIATKTRPDYAKQSGGKVIIQKKSRAYHCWQAREGFV
jgi:hypothetical protein